MPTSENRLERFMLVFFLGICTQLPTQYGVAENAYSPTQTVGKHPVLAVIPVTFVSGIQGAACISCL
jgi:hypothetical protein